MNPGDERGRLAPRPGPLGYDTSGGFGPTDDFDSPSEVDATFFTQRRVAFGYGLLFLIVVLGAPALNIVLGWWTSARLLGGMSPSFALLAVGLYAFFFVLALAAASLANAVEDAMLGSLDGDDTDGDTVITGGPP